MLNCPLVSWDVYFIGISRVNMWVFGDKAWVGLLLTQTRWAEWPPPTLLGFYDSMNSWLNPWWKELKAAEFFLYNPNDRSTFLYSDCPEVDSTIMFQSDRFPLTECPH